MPDRSFAPEQFGGVAALSRSSAQPTEAARPGYARTRVGELQRQRLIAALIESVEELGGPQPTVAQIISRARVSRKTFYDIFSDREECFLAALEETFTRARARSVQAYSEQSGWREGVRAGLACLLELMDDEPGLARLCVVHSLAAGDRVRLRRAELMAQLAERIDLGRGSASRNDLPELAGEAVLGGILAIIHARIVYRDPSPLSDLLAPLMALIVLPYLGLDAACEEHARAHEPLPRTREHSSPPAREADPLSGLKIRLTYRTVRVLVSLGEHPDASNREVAELAGVSDQGQVCKLLARLARLGLIENRGEGQAKGGSNAWRLTARGARLERATRPRLT